MHGFPSLSIKTVLHYHGKCYEHKIGDLKKFPLNHNIFLNMKKKRRKKKLFDINKLIKNDE